MIIDVYKCPVCGAFVDKIYRLNVVANTGEPGFQMVYVCGNCFKPAAIQLSATTTAPQQLPRAFNLDLLQSTQPTQQAQQETQEQAALVEYAREQIHNKAAQLGIDANSAYKKAYRIDLEKDTDMSRLDRYNEKLGRQIAAAKTTYQAGQKAAKE